ncbi:MAG: hypothetical protein ABI587_10815 [Gemmatimonadales bacterium]
MTRARPTAPSTATLLAGLCLLATAPVSGQGPSPAAVQRASLQRFQPWIGSWSGSGWSLDRTGRRTEFDLQETVASKVGGTVLLVEGHGTAKGDSAPSTHDGLVLLYYDEHSARYRWNGHELGSGTVDAEATPLEGGLAWSIPAGTSGATVRFTIWFDEHCWHEVGEASADGTNWAKFMEVDLERVH